MEHYIVQSVEFFNKKDLEERITSSKDGIVVVEEVVVEIVVGIAVDH